MSRYIVAFVCSLCVIGCDDRTPDPDAGGGADAGRRIDAGGTDAGADTDAGGATDAGADTDAGEGPDAGASDAGRESDAGSESDAGPSTDGGLPLGDTCEDAIDLTEGGTVSGSTIDATDDYDTLADDSCPRVSSYADRVYVLAPSSDRTYSAAVTPLTDDFDPFLFVRGDCESDACVAGSITHGADQTEFLSFEVSSGTTVYLIVDGETFVRGGYRLSLTFE